MREQILKMSDAVDMFLGGPNEESISTLPTLAAKGFRLTLYSRR
jgi:hypothetical protein